MNNKIHFNKRSSRKGTNRASSLEILRIYKILKRSKRPLIQKEIYNQMIYHPRFFRDAIHTLISLGLVKIVKNPNRCIKGYMMISRGKQI